MLIPLTRKSFEELVPAVATGAQYAHNWGKLSDLLRRVLISVVGIFLVVLLKALFFRHGFDEILLVFGLGVGLYWLWGPILTASLLNIECRRYGYCGFWQGKVLDIYMTEELVGTQETVNKRGDLVVVENRERCINLEVGDELGFLTSLKVPLKRSHQAIDVGDTAELLVFSNRADLGRIAKTSDIYISDHNLWVSDYPYVRRDAFIEVSRRINLRLETEESPRSPQSPRSSSQRASMAPERDGKRKRIPKTDANGGLKQPSQRTFDDRRNDYPDSDASLSQRRSSRRRPVRDLDTW